MTRKTPSSGDGSSNKTLALLIGTTCGIVAGPNISFAGPAGGVVTGGQGTISTPTTTSTVIDQSSNRLSIDWRSFDVAANESVNFRQPSSNSVALNRILDQKASEVFGRIDANGRVVLFNSNGILFGPGSQVNVGSLVATSLNVVSFDDSTGQLRLSAAGSPGSIVNSGTISAAPGGSVSLVGGAVANNGLIVADLGSVNLAAGRSATIDLYGGGLLRFEADSSLTSNSSGAAAGVNNAGQIMADGGQVLLTTSAVQNVFERAVNNDGLVRASRIDNSGGSIRLVGAGGTVINSGVLDASGTGAASTGGEVQVLGENVGLFGNARVDVSGDAGGGTALIGGDFQGANPDVLNASQTIVAPGASIAADARLSGNGGRVILWSEEGTRFYGGISARGASSSGNGGFSEVSSHGVLAFNGLVNLGAPAGAGGHLLLDPVNITIEDGGNDDTDLDFDDPPTDASIDADDIVTALGTASVTLSARTDIVVDEEIDAGTLGADGAGITLLAGDDIVINENITTNNGNIVLTAHATTPPGFPPVGADGNGNVTFDNNVSLNAGTGDIIISGQGNLAIESLAADAISLTSTGGSVTRAGGTLTGASLSVTAGTTIDLDTNIDTLTSAAAATTLRIDNTGDLDVASATGTALILTSTGNLTGAGIAGTSLIVSGDSVDIDTAVGTLTQALATTGSLEIDNTGALIITNAEGITGVDISATGNLTVGTVDGGSGAAVLSSGAAIDDDLQANSTITGANVSLTAATNIGTIDNLAAGTGRSIDVATNGPLTAHATSVAGVINLNLVAPTTPTLGAGAIELGTTGNAATGSVLLQSTGNLDLSALANIIDLNAGVNASVGFRSGADLTLPGDVNGLFDAAPATLAVRGANDIVDGGGLGFDFTVGHLIFDSGAASGNVNLATTVDQLTASIGNSSNLTVNQTGGSLELVNVQAEGGIDVTADGTITATLVDANGGDVIIDSNGGGVVLTNVESEGIIDVEATANITAGEVTALNFNDITLESTSGAIVDDSNQATMITGDGLRLSGTSIGSLAANGDIDTDVTNLDFNATNGNIVLRELTSAGITGFSANGGSITRIETVNGSMSMNVNMRPTTGDIEITARGAGVGMDYTAFTIGSQAGNDSVTLRAGGNLQVGTLVASDVTLESGLGQASGNLVLNQLSGTFQNVVVNSSGTITDDGTITASVNSDTLTIGRAASVNIDTSVNSLDADGVTGALTVNDRLGSLQVTNATAAGAVTVTSAGTMTVDNAASTGGLVTLSTNGGSLDATTVSGTSASLSTDGTMTLGTLTTTGGAASLVADGAIDVTSMGTGGGNATLNSGLGMNVNSLNTGGGVAQLTASGAVILGAVDVGAGTATMNTTGSISDAGGSTASVSGSRLTVTAANGVNLVTDVDIIDMAGVTNDIILSQQRNVQVDHANTTGLVNISSDGNMSVASASGTSVTLDVQGSLSLTAANAVNTAGTATLRADGAITDTVNAPASSVTANRLLIDRAGSVNLDTNVNILEARNVTGALSISEQSGPLTVDEASGGAVSVLSTGGALSVTNATSAGLLTLASNGIGSSLTVTNSSGVGANLSSGGDLTLTGTVGAGNGTANLTSGTTMTLTGSTINAGSAALTSNGVMALGAVNANATTGTVSLTAGAAGAISGGTVAANQLNITNSASANLTTNVNRLSASVGTGPLTIVEANALAVTNATSTSGSVDVSTTAGALDVTMASGNGVILTANGATSDLTVSSVNANSGAAVLTAGDEILDNDEGIVATSTISGSSVTLSATNGIGSVTDAATTAGSSIDVNTTGALTANVASGSGAINLNLVGAPTIASGAISLGSGAASGRVLLQSGNDLNLQLMDPNAIVLGAGNTATVGYVSSGTVTLRSGNATLDAAPANLLVHAQDIVQGAGLSRTIDLDAGSLSFTATAPGGSYVLNTNAGTLNADVTSGFNLEVNDDEGNLSLGRIVAQTFDVQSVGAISDAAGATPSVVANQLTISGGTSADLDTDVNTLDASGVSGSLTVREQSGDLAVGNANAAGAVDISTTNGALSVTSASGNGVTLTAGGAGGITLGTVDAGAGTATLAAGGAIGDGAGTTPSVVANQLTITGASTADLITNVNTLNASGVTGALTLAEASGPLTVTNASAGGAVGVSAANGALSNVTASGSNVTLSAAGTGGAISLASVNATGTVSLVAGDGAITNGAGVSVVANQLEIVSAGSADLNTNVNALSASVGAGALAISEISGPLMVTSATATGAVSISTVNGAMNVTNAASSGGALSLSAGGTGALNVTTASGTSATLTSGGNMVIAGNTLNAGTGAATLNSGGSITLGTVNAGSAALTANGNITLGSINATGTVSLAAGGGAISDGAGVSVTANQLTITSASAADLNTNVNTLNATGVNGNLTIAEASGPLTVANASATGAVTLSAAGGALSNVNASGSSVTLSATGISLGTVSSAGTVSLVAGGGAITDAAGANASVEANQLAITGAGSADLDTNIGTLNANVTGGLAIRDQNALTVGTVTAGSANLASNGAMTLGTVNVGGGNATLTASGGALTDGTTGATSLTAGAANITAASIGTSANTLNTSVASLIARSTSGGMFFREANDITLTDLGAASNQDIVVGTTGDITVGHIEVGGSGGNGRVLLAATGDILASGSDVHITAQNVELRAGFDETGGQIGTAATPLRIVVPATVPGGNGTTVPSVLLLQNASAANPAAAAQENQVETVSGAFDISKATFNPDAQNPETFLTTTFSTRTAVGEGVRVENASFNAIAALGLSTVTGANVLSTALEASNSQGEGTLYIDWASFDPNVSLFGTMNPPICLPSDQSEEDAEPADAAATTAAASGGCAATTAQYEGSFRLPQVKLVITSRGVEWVTTPSGKVSVFPLIGQVR